MVPHDGRKGEERKRRALIRDVNERVSELDATHDLRLALDWVCECAERNARSSARKTK
jgi:hypothetical protein